MRVTENLKGMVIDKAYRVTDQSALSIATNSCARRGFLSDFLPASIWLARSAWPRKCTGQVIVTLLCDSGIRYLSKTFNPDWLRAHGLTQISPSPKAAIL